MDGPDRISKAVTRTVWSLLSEELVSRMDPYQGKGRSMFIQNLTLTRNAPGRVQPLKTFVDEVRARGIVKGVWNMGQVRAALGAGWPQDQTIDTSLGAAKLGPLQWWHAVSKYICATCRRTFLTRYADR